MGRRGGLAAIVWVGCAQIEDAAPVQVWADEGVVRVTGLTAAEWEAAVRDRLLTVTLVEEEVPYPHRPLAGERVIQGDVVEFRPRSALLAGQTYAVRAAGVDFTVTLPKVAAPAAAVIGVYPTAPVVPENLLKVHLHFSTPVGDGQIPQRVHLNDESGVRVSGAFYASRPELWDASRRQLTLTFDPGRVKTGLIRHEEAGRALVAGTTMTLEIEAGWRDLSGSLAAEPVHRTIQVTSADHDMAPFAEWIVHAPPAGTRAPLRVDLPEPLDQATLATFVRVLDASAQPLSGDITLTAHEQTWVFVPTAPWPDADLTVSVDPRIEDLAGNNFQESFEHTWEAAPAPDASAPLRVAFRPSPMDTRANIGLSIAPQP